jgi:predicted GNAT family acetyltransferase
VAPSAEERTTAHETGHDGPVTDITVQDEPTASRFAVHLDGQTAELVYRLVDGQLVLIHTGVPPELEGHGLGGRLVAAAVDRAEAEGLTLVPRCPFARDWLEHHPEAVERVAVDWP